MLSLMDRKSCKEKRQRQHEGLMQKCGGKKKKSQETPLEGKGRNRTSDHGRLPKTAEKILMSTSPET